MDEASPDLSWSTTHFLAQEHKFSSYDAAYLELSIRCGLPQASLNTQLRIAARAEKVELLG